MRRVCIALPVLASTVMMVTMPACLAARWGASGIGGGGGKRATCGFRARMPVESGGIASPHDEQVSERESHDKQNAYNSQPKHTKKFETRLRFIEKIYVDAATTAAAAEEEGDSHGKRSLGPTRRREQKKKQIRLERSTYDIRKKNPHLEQT